MVALSVALTTACSYHERNPPAVDSAVDGRPADTRPGDTAADVAADGPSTGVPPEVGDGAGHDPAPSGPDAVVEARPPDGPAPETPPPEAGATPPTPEQLAFGCPEDAELRACYTFDDPNPMTDGSGRGNDMMRNTAQWVADGARGGTLRFTTGRQFAVIPDSPSLRLAGSEATFEAWIRPTMSSGTDGGADTIASKFTSSFTGWSFAAYNHEVRLYVTGSINAAAGTFQDSRWTHVAIVLSKTGVDIYLDGVKRNPMPLPPLTMTANQESVTVGGLDPVNLGALPPERFAFHGDIDVLRIYGRPRRPDEICAASGRTFMGGSCRPGSAPPP
jgi:hypothetical protein